MKYTIAPSPVQTMNSLQIAELVDSRHDSVKRTIERLVEQEVISQPPLVDGEKSANGVITKVYLFSGEQGKLDSITVVAQLCPQYTADIVRQWQQLEKIQEQTPLYQIAEQMVILATGIQTALAKLNHTERYIELLEFNQKGAIKITPEVVKAVKDYKAQGYTQASISRFLRISSASVSLIVNDKYPVSDLPSDDNVTKLLKTAQGIVAQNQQLQLLTGA